MLLDQLPQVKSLSKAQKFELAGELWDEVTAEADLFEPHPDVLKLLETRYQHWQDHPESAVSWDELKRRLGKS